MSKSAIENGRDQNGGYTMPSGPTANMLLGERNLERRTIVLKARNRLKMTMDSALDMLSVQAGIVALEAMPAGGRRQILDFLLPGDIIPASIAVGQPAFYLRAVVNATLAARAYGTDPFAHFDEDEAPSLLDHLRLHLDRRNLHQIAIGQLNTEPRVASFLLVFALRVHGALRQNTRLELPMSRDDIADYLAINPDTLSRIMMRFAALGLIRRLDRHAVVLVDVEELARQVPLKLGLLAGWGTSKQV